MIQAQIPGINSLFLGIKNGIEGLKSGPDYLSPINDILYCPSASGGETLTDALTETYKIINTTRKINGLEENLPKNGAIIFLVLH